MNHSTFGRLKRIKSLRKHWPREDTNSTPWLSDEENIAILGETIRIELEVLAEAMLDLALQSDAADECVPGNRGGGHRAFLVEGDP